MTFQNKLTSLITDRARLRKSPSEFYDLSDIPPEVVPHGEPLSLASGCPNEGFFPVEAIHLDLIDEPFQHLNYENKSSLTNLKNVKSEDAGFEVNNTRTCHTYRYSPIEYSDKIDIAAGFQYASSDSGFPQLKKFARELTKTVNDPAYKEWDVLITNGSLDSFHKVCDLLIEQNGTVLVEEFTFTPFNSTAGLFNATVIPVKLNIRPQDGAEPGIDAEYLDNLLTNWYQSEYRHLTKPKALYTIPTGQNPTGLSQSLRLRRRIYSIAEKHDFVIVEDDPYGYISLPKYGTANCYEDDSLSNEAYIKNLLKPSYVSIDYSGRVVRLDTFSKMFAPGLRLGFIVANKYFIERLSLFGSLTTRAPSGISQLLLTNVIQHWGGIDGWLSWCKKVAKYYTIRRDYFLNALYESKSFIQGQFEVVEPDAGMFIILFINFEHRFPDTSTWRDLLAQLRYKTIMNGIDVVFGYKMSTDPTFKHTLSKSHFLRVTTAAVYDNDEIVEAAKRLTRSIEQFFSELDSGLYDYLKK